MDTLFWGGGMIISLENGWRLGRRLTDASSETCEATVTHSEESAIRHLLHTRAHRPQWLSSVIMIDRDDGNMPFLLPRNRGQILLPGSWPKMTPYDTANTSLLTFMWLTVDRHFAKPLWWVYYIRRMVHITTPTLTIQVMRRSRRFQAPPSTRAVFSSLFLNHHILYQVP